jgi:hypothetical protein
MAGRLLDTGKLWAKKALPIRPIPPMNAGMAACNRRSPVLLECHALMVMATMAVA